MGNIQEIVILEIPVYSETRDVFEKRWQNFFKRESIDYGGPEPENYISLIKDIYYPKYVWKHNRICGFINISLRGDDLYINLYKCNKQRYPYNSKIKNFIIPYNIPGTHFRLFDNNNEVITNEAIRVKIMEMLKWIMNNSFDKNIFVDLDHVGTIIEYLDINKMCIDFLQEFTNKNLF